MKLHLGRLSIALCLVDVVIRGLEAPEAAVIGPEKRRWVEQDTEGACCIPEGSLLPSHPRAAAGRQPATVDCSLQRHSALPGSSFDCHSLGCMGTTQVSKCIGDSLSPEEVWESRTLPLGEVPPPQMSSIRIEPVQRGY